MTNREKIWTSSLRDITTADAKLQTDQLLGFSGLSGGLLKRSYGITALPTDLVDVGAYDDLVDVGAYDRISYVKTGIGNQIASFNSDQDSIYAINKAVAAKESGDVLEGGWLTYAVPGLAVATMAFLLVDHMIRNEKGDSK